MHQVIRSTFTTIPVQSACRFMIHIKKKDGAYECVVYEAKKRDGFRIGMKGEKNETIN